jgi:hypothetical protein
LLKVKAKANSKGDLKELASCCNVLGELFQQQGKYEDAILEHEVLSLIMENMLTYSNNNVKHFVGGARHLQ